MSNGANNQTGTGDAGLQVEDFVAGEPLRDQLTASRLNQILAHVRRNRALPSKDLLVERTRDGFRYSMKRQRRPKGGGEADKSCCGIGDNYYSTELNTAFNRAPGARQLLESQETQWAGMAINEGSDGIWTATSGSYVWAGDEPGISGVTFNAVSGNPDPSSFELFPLPEKLVATVGGDAYTLEIVNDGQAPLQYTGTYVLRWLWGQGSEGTWILGDLWERAAKVGDMVGGYLEPGSDPENTAHIGIPDTAGGEDGQVQRNSGGALMGSGALKVVTL